MLKSCWIYRNESSQTLEKLSGWGLFDGNERDGAKKFRFFEKRVAFFRIISYNNIRQLTAVQVSSRLDINYIGLSPNGKALDSDSSM